MKCCICGDYVIGMSHNAEPLGTGRCCDACNTLVIQKRLIDMQIAIAGETN